VSAFSQDATAGEREVASRLIKAAIAAVYSVSVNDGENWTVRRSFRPKAVEDALCTTGEDRLSLHDAAGEHAGSFYLVWGNAADGSELIADHTANETCEKLWKHAMGDLA